MDMLRDALRVGLGLPPAPAPAGCARVTQGAAPAFVDSLGWCTWNSFYTDVSRDKVKAGLDSFRVLGVQPGFVILDDGWQHTNCDHELDGGQWAGRLQSYEANHKFPPGEGSLEMLVRDAKQGATGVDYFFCWHAFAGYWAGADPTSAAFADMDIEDLRPHVTASITRMSIGNPVHDEPFAKTGVGVVHPRSIGDFYSSYHAALRRVGVDGVKVDAQSAIPLLKDPTGGCNGWERTVAYHQELRTSILRHFDSKDQNIIHCMCHSHETLLAILALSGSSTRPSSSARDVSLASQVSSCTGLPLVRCSDDFWPGEGRSHAPHVYINTMNMLFFSKLGIADWDMFVTNMGPISHMHAAARAISGGPVYISDRPGEQDVTLLQQMAFPDGTVPRCVTNARPASRFLFSNPQRTVGEPLVIQNQNRIGGVLLCCNVTGHCLENVKDMFREVELEELSWASTASAASIRSEQPMEQVAAESVPVSRFPAWCALAVSDVQGAQQWALQGAVVFQRSTSTLCSIDGLRIRDHELCVSLPGRFDFDIFTVSPWHVFERQTGTGTEKKQALAFVGYPRMLNPGGALLRVTVRAGVIETESLGCGEFLVASRFPQSSGTKVTVASALVPSKSSVSALLERESADIDCPRTLLCLDSAPVYDAHLVPWTGCGCNGATIHIAQLHPCDENGQRCRQINRIAFTFDKVAP